ncbi:hypothetical protein AHMF7605_28665 [Adhaeribacter arboris]|uniref:Restriction endonuclease type IV Mrr domain-containing protein n=1 Tax=Adhaeribacter arboris TaxID=2072846 RepID=A0A2T2Y8Q5_9BACT|nr:restriction endonuclease [Adhaeribacter arboris]PSR51887.1 hypothetical protein AHMF7605_28665 [Adhaeribacter arboris]
MITVNTPNNWKDLQIKVAEILKDCGFTTEIEKIVITARGQVELDVYAQEQINGRKYSIICECKFWNSSIPQAVVHGFRTIVSDIGSNIGYIITTSNFQKGAINTTEFTNVELLTWDEFQNKFFESWFEKFFIFKITKELDPLMTYTEPILPMWFPLMSLEDKQNYYSLKEKYDVIGYIIMVHFSTYSRMLVKKDIPKLPLIELIKEDTEEIEKRIPKDILTEVGYREFLDKIIAFGKVGITSFRELRDKYSKSEDPE